MKTIIVISIICGSIILISGLLILAIHDYNINLLENGIIKEKILKKEKEEENKLIKNKEEIETFDGNYIFLEMNNGMVIFIMENKNTDEIRIDYNFSDNFLKVGE